MKPADDHSRWDEDLAAYAIGALDARDTVAFADHLTTCDLCRGELHRLAPAIELLPASVEQLEPPPALRGRIMAAVAEQEEAGAAEPHRRSWRERIGGWRVPALPIAATATALAVAFAIGFVVRGQDGATQPGRTTVPVTALAPAAEVRAQLVSDGGSWQLDVARMPRLPAGRVYQAWVMRRGRDVEPSTVFVLARDGSSTVAIPQSLAAGDQVLVTREPRGGSTVPSSRPLLSARV